MLQDLDSAKKGMEKEKKRKGVKEVDRPVALVVKILTRRAELTRQISRLEDFIFKLDEVLDALTERRDEFEISFMPAQGAAMAVPQRKRKVGRASSPDNKNDSR